ncbi:xanthine dehydrogenase small subunit [Microvirga lotononidis]|uniref:Xanthine dehydrogenase, small subunit n=1 Tax=Microvirga lotononidis TaxID=864069 RepID=I4YNB1_9HYPH|nr:xanthine dehydrogenase small subunit [Microvirga lotononidis]EIM25453.1 xanthine dehydrogenase, small subunit [Microvirga lotononidis]WQO26235.1 xanthine dehydrogenase small subunit [Microvirga lotononidis]
MVRDTIRFWRNGQAVEVSGFHPRTTLLDYLRLQERRVGTKEGCAEGDCGACTVALGRVRGGRVHYEPINACILLLGQIDGAELVTVEDLTEDGDLHPVQAAMVAHHGSQCGFCTPGIVMSLFTLYHASERPLSRESVNDALAGNLCRCTGYRPIVDAALQVCTQQSGDSFSANSERTAQGLMSLADERDVFIGTEDRFFAAPASEASLAALYARHPDATLVAGCTDVGLWITKAMMEIEKVIWLGRVAGLDLIEDSSERLAIGATVTHAEIHPSLDRIDPDLGEIMRRFGSLQVRASGTVGGSIANGSPIGDLAPALIALGAELELRQGDGTRTLPLDDFFIAYRRQDRKSGEFVRLVTVPKLRAHEVFRAYKISKRFDEDISAALGAFKFTLDGRRIVEARIAFGGMAGTPKRATETERALIGLSLDEPSSWGEAMAAMARDYQPLDDHRASSAYRSTVARNLVFKALSETASGETRATRIIGRRDTLQAAE